MSGTYQNGPSDRAVALDEKDPNTWEPAWASDAKLRAEFGDRKEVFLASMKNWDKGRLFGSRADFQRGDR